MERQNRRGFSVVSSVLTACSVCFVVASRATAQNPTVFDQRAYIRMGYGNNGQPLTIPSIDASGIAYHAPSNHLFIVDSEIEEVSAVWSQIQANVFEVELDGETLIGSYDLGNDEPTGIVYNELDGHFYVTNDDARTITRYSFDGSAFVAVDSASTLPDAPDPEGITCDPSTGNIYVLEGTQRKILTFTYQGGFTQTSTTSLGACPTGLARDVEGVTFDPVTNHLYVVSEPALSLYEYDLAGNCIAEFDISLLSPRPIAPQGMTMAPAEDGSSLSLFVADGGIDNAVNPNERDAAVYEGWFGHAPPGDAFHFNGLVGPIGDHLQVPYAPELYPQAITITAWIRPSQLRQEDYIVSTKDRGGYGFGLGIRSAKPDVLSSRCRVGGTYYNVSGTTPLAIDRWAHVALTYDGAAFKLYLNGIEDGSLAVAGALDPSSGDLFIGAESGGNSASGDYFAGRIDEVVLWNVALPQDQIALSCTPITSGLPEPNNVVAHWRFERFNGNETPDETGRHPALVMGADHITPGVSTASVAFRNRRPNPSTYTASPPVLGSTWTARVDLTATGHPLARVFGYTSPASVSIGRGQFLLVGGARLFLLPLRSGPVATWNVPIPPQCSFLGIEVFTQAVHVGAEDPFELTNAQDLVVGY